MRPEGSIALLITGDISTDTLGGPIMIAQMAGDSAKAGVGSLISFIALISINLAIINQLNRARQNNPTLYLYKLSIHLD